MANTLTGQAEILRLLAENPSADRYALAKLFEREYTPDVEQGNEQPVEQLDVVSGKVGPDKPKPTRSQPQGESFWRLLEADFSDKLDALEAPQFFRDGLNASVEDAHPRAVAIQQAPLNSASSLQTLVTKVLAVDTKPASDWPKIYNAVAERRALDPWPTELVTTERHLLVFVDVNRAMRPFRNDMLAFRTEILQRVPRNRISLVYPRGRDLRQWARRGALSWLREQSLDPAMFHDAHWLVVSDLGCSRDGGDCISHGWQSCLALAATQGVVSSVVFPGNLAKLQTPASVRQALALPASSSPAKTDDFEQLWLAVALASFVTPALLRDMRTALDMLDPLLEAQVWRDTRAIRQDNGIQIRGRQAIRAREKFRDFPLDQQTTIAEVLNRHLQAMAPHLQAEGWAILRSLGLPASEPAAFLVRQIQQIKQQKKGSEYLLMWATVVSDSASRTMFENSEELSALAAQSALTRGKVLPAGVDASQVAWLQAVPGDKPRFLSLVQHDQHIILQDKMAAGVVLATFRHAGETVFLKVERDADAPWQSLTVGNPIYVGDAQSIQLQSSHGQIKLDRISKPEWAMDIGNDSNNLFVKTVLGKAYWVPDTVMKEQTALPRISAECYMPESLGAWWSSRQIDLLKECTLSATMPMKLRICFHDDSAFELKISQKIYRFIWIPPGEFLMGSPETEHGRDDDEGRHKVVLTQGFWLAETACTQHFWRALMGENPSYFEGGDFPVEQVSWEDIQIFLNKLNQSLQGIVARLPTEAEWEYACRAGTETAFSFGASPNLSRANYNGKWDLPDEDVVIAKGEWSGRTAPVGHYVANDWGFYQMHGNVFEWCEDIFGSYPQCAVADPIGAEGEKGKRVMRGGAWNYSGGSVRSANRRGNRQGFRNSRIGFRLAMSPAVSDTQIE